jgi:Peptidase A4 family
MGVRARRRAEKGAFEAVKHQRGRRGGQVAARRRQARNCLWLLAAAGCIAFAVVAVTTRPSSPGRTVRVAAETGAVSSAAGPGGGPGGPMAAGPGGVLYAGSGSSGSLGAAGSSATGSGSPSGSGGSDGWDGSGGWDGWSGLGSFAGGQVSGIPANATAATSQNWAGYAASGTPGTFTSVSSSWTEPAVTCTAQQTFSSFWVGLDGDGTQTVEQAGTEADCNNGKASYQGWFEMFPSAPVFYNNPVAAGDAMSASVAANGGGAFTLTLSDQTQGWTQTTHQTSAAAQLGSAEIIAEAPSDATNVLPLSSFGTVNFTAALVDNAALGSTGPAALIMVSAAGVTEATPSALTNGDSFSVTWDSNGTAAGAAPASSASAAPAPMVTPTTTPTISTSSGEGHHRHHYGN